ncbi:unnamed protein product [Auanema sp. JU1783]|nr:unnamed protein product [Auanema sp. JU1783]
MGPKSLLIAFSLILPIVSADETCLSQSQLAGIIFGSVIGSVVICTVIAIVLWRCMRNRSKEPKMEEKAAYTNPACDIEDKACDAMPTKKLSQKDQMTMIDSFKLRRKVLDAGTQKSFSSEHINEVDAQVGVQLKSDDLGGFGFNITGSMNEGIFVKTVHPKGQAEQTGNILEGDRIKSLTISFEGMVCEDAITLLSYSSPYKVKLELERRLNNDSSSQAIDGSPRLHPLFRSNTLTNIHFNPITCPTQRCPSLETTQRHALPATIEDLKNEKEIEEEEQTQVPDSTSSWTDITPETAAIEGDISKMESSDYASDNTSDYRESLSDDKDSTHCLSSSSQDTNSLHTVSDRIEISELVVDKPLVSPNPKSATIEYCAALPPKPKKIVSRSPSPKIIAKSPSPVPRVPTPTQRKPSPPPTPPTPVKSKIQPPSPPVQQSGIPIRREKTQTKMSPPKGPEITEARVSRIPKRTDSMKTPVLERKLPALPRSVTQRSHSAEDKGDDTVWSRLYQEKKGTLRKTREPSAGAVSSTVTSPKVQRTPSSADKFASLSREHREKLQHNQNTLERQREELRQLGIL